MPYSPTSWWYRVPSLVNLHNTWWICRSQDPPSPKPENILVQATAPTHYPSSMCLGTCTWRGQRGAAYGKLLRLLTHVRVGGARFVALCFVDFRDFHDSVEYGVACDKVSEISCFYEWKLTNISQVTLLMKSAMWKRQHLTYMFNIRYECFCNQLVSC